MVEDEIVSRLTTYAGVSAISSGRLTPGDLIPQSQTLPAQSYRIIDVDPVKTISVSSSAGLHETWIQVSSWATTYDVATNLSEQTRLALEGYTVSAADVIVSGIDFDDHRDQYEDTVQAYRRIADYTVWHTVS